MGTRIKVFESTGLAPNGRLYAGDLNGIQDHLADQSNFSQEVDAAIFGIGEAALQLLRYAAGEARLSGALRTDSILRGLGGIVAGAFTTVQRNAIPANFAPYGLLILNTTTNQYEWNKGTDVARNWQPFGFVPGSGAGAISDGDISPTAAIQASKLAGYPNDVRKQLNGDGSWTYSSLDDQHTGRELHAGGYGSQLRGRDECSGGKCRDCPTEQRGRISNRFDS